MNKCAVNNSACQGRLVRPSSCSLSSPGFAGALLVQTALILDTLRSAQYLYRQQREYKISSVLVCGHSMGGAGAIVAASKLKVGGWLLLLLLLLLLLHVYVSVCGLPKVGHARARPRAHRQAQPLSAA